jgi:hypothetical protein
MIYHQINVLIYFIKFSGHAEKKFDNIYMCMRRAPTFDRKMSEKICASVTRKARNSVSVKSIKYSLSVSQMGTL